MSLFDSRLQDMSYPLPREWSEEGIREFLHSRNAEDKHFECKAFLHFDWKLKCEAEKAGLKDLAEKPFHNNQPVKSYLTLRVIECILAFANADGGLLFLGVAEEQPDLPPIEAIPITSRAGDTKFVITGIERDGIGFRDGVFDQDRYKQQLQNILFPNIDNRHEYTEKRIENGQLSTRRRTIKYSRDYRRDLVDDIHVILLRDKGRTKRNIAILIIRPSSTPVCMYEFIEGRPADSVPKLYKRLAFNNNGPLVGDELMCYLQSHSAASAEAPKTDKDPVPQQFREALNDYVVPVIEGKPVVTLVGEALARGENVFVIGESGMGKSLLLADCYLKLKTNQPACYHTIDRTQGPALYESAPVLCSIRQQIELIDGMPRIAPPVRYESKVLWVWEKEYIEILLKAWSEANPEKRLVLFLDGLDENYIPTRETEFILHILKSLVEQKKLNVSWVFSSQPRKGIGWIKNCFCIINLEGLGRLEAVELLKRVMGSKRQQLHGEILRRATMENNQYDPEMLVMIAKAIDESNTIPFQSQSSCKAFFDKLPLNFREKYTWLFSRYTDAAVLADIANLADNARRWERLVPAVSYTRFLTDILSILSVSRSPMPIDILEWALELEDSQSRKDFRGRALPAFRRYPQEAVENAGFLKTALDDLRRFIKIVEEADGACSFCKDAVRQSFISFISKDSIESTRTRLFQLAMDELDVMNPQNLHQRPDYLLSELLHLLSFRRNEAVKGLERLFLSEFFPEWLQTRAERNQGESWSSGFLQDLALFDDRYLSQPLAERLRIVRDIIQGWILYLNEYLEFTAILFRNAVESKEIWPPTTETSKLMIPHGGYMRRLKGHYDYISSLAVLQDGRLASGGRDGRIIIWDLETDKCQILDADIEGVSNLTVLPDGRLVSTGMGSPTIIWNTETGEGKRGPGVFDLLVHPDGRLITIDIYGNVSVWDVDAESKLEFGFDDINDFASIAILPNNRLAVVYESKGVWIWDLKTDSTCQLAAIEGDRYIGSDLQILSDGRLVYRTSDDAILILNIDSGHITVLTDKIASRSILVLPDQRIVAGDSKGHVHVWNLSTGKHNKWKGHKKAVNKLILLMDGRFASSGSDNNIIIWDAANGKRKRIDGGERDFISEAPHQLLELPDGRIASVHDDYSVRIWNVDNGDCKVYAGHNEGATCFLILPNGCLATSHKDGCIRIWDAERNVCKTLEGTKNEVLCMALLPEGRILSGGEKGNITIWDVHSDDKEVITSGTGEDIKDLKAMGDSRAIACIGKEDICVWDIQHRTCHYINKVKRQRSRFEMLTVPCFKEKIEIIDRETLASKDEKNICIWNIQTGEKRILKGHEEDVSVLKALPDGRLASGSNDGTIRIWDDRLRKSVVLKGHEENVLSLALLGDNRLVSGDKGGTIRIWDLNTNESYILKGASSPIHRLYTLPDDRIVSCSREQVSVGVWNSAAAEKVQDSVTRLRQNEDDVTDMREKIGFLEAPPTFLTYWESRNCLVVGTEAGIEFFRI